METLAAVEILRGYFPDLRIRVVNVVDLMRLQDDREHPHGLSDAAFDAYFTADKPVIFAYHGYPWLIHRLTYRRTNHENFHVRGYVEEGTTTTPFDICVMNRIDRYDLAIDVIDRVPRLRHGRRARPRPAARPAQRAPAVRPHARRGPARDPRLAVDRHLRRHGSPAATSRCTSPRHEGSRRQRRIEQPEARPAGRRRRRDRGHHRRALAGGGAPGAAAATSSPSCGPVDAVGHRVVHGGPRHTRAGAAWTTLLVGYLYSISRPGPAAQPAGAGRRPLRAATCCPTCRPWRASTPPSTRRIPAAAAHVRAAAGVERAVGAAALRLPRPLARLRRPPRRASSSAGGRGPADRHLPPRRRRLPRRRARRGLRGHHHGLHPAGRAGDEHPAGHARPRPPALAARARPRARGRAGRRPRAPLRASRGCPARRATCARCSPAGRTATRRARSPSTSTCTGWPGRPRR